MSTRAIKKERAAKRKLAGFDSNPPTCGSCINFKPIRRAGDIVLSPICDYNEFGTHAGAVCDFWENNNGEVLAD